MKICLVGGTRPNFIKLAPIVRACRSRGMDYKLVHTGQHYDAGLSDIFFEELGIPQPNINLNVGSASHAHQTARIMMDFENYCEHLMPDVVVVVGDVNSTMACSLVASKFTDIKLAHVEAGLRCYDRHKPEEVNRVVTDVLSNYLFVTTDYAIKNLIKEGVSKEQIYLVGDVVLDNLIYNMTRIDYSKRDDYALVTIHRPASTDTPENLSAILRSLQKLSDDMEIVFPIHPRTRKRIEEFSLHKYTKRLNIIEPVGHMEFLSLMVGSKLVVSDSGGVQVETSFLGIPCVSVMETTSHIYTLEKGTNMLADIEKDDIYRKAISAIKHKAKPYRDSFADGKAAQRIIDILLGV